MDSDEKFELMKADDRAAALSSESSMFLNVAKFEQMQRVATMLARSDFIPERFKGNTGNCMIALDMASLMGMHPVMLMRTMYVVAGTPGFAGKFVSALINNSGRYVDPLEYEWKGEQGTPQWGCRAFAVRKSTGKTVYGPWVTWKMVMEEGWNKDKPYKSGNGIQRSKWNTMPELMFVYRATSYFGSKNDADLLMGMRTIEEIEDSQAELIKQPDGSYGIASDQKPKANTYDVNATAPETSNKEEEQAQPPAPRPEQKDEEQPAPAPNVDDFGTSIDSVFAKSNWFHLRKGTPEEGTGFAAFLKRNAESMGQATSITYNAMFDKYKSFYNMPWPYLPDGQLQTDKESQAAYDWVNINGKEQQQQQETAQEQSEEEKSIFESDAAQLLASMARKHKREYMMVVRKRVPESIEEIYGWIEEINQLVVKHQTEGDQGEGNEQF